MSKWELTRWWSLYTEDGKFKAETSNPREIAAFYEKGDIVYRTYRKEKFKAVEVDIHDSFSDEEISEIKKEYEETYAEDD